MGKKKKVKQKASLEILLSIRKTWGDFNPCTRVEEDKKKYNRTRNKRYDVDES